MPEGVIQPKNVFNTALATRAVSRSLPPAGVTTLGVTLSPARACPQPPCTRVLPGAVPHAPHPRHLLERLEHFVQLARGVGSWGLVSPPENPQPVLHVLGSREEERALGGGQGGAHRAPKGAGTHWQPRLARHLLLHGVPALQAAVVRPLHTQQHLGVKLQRLRLGKVTEKGHGCRDGGSRRDRPGQALGRSDAGSGPCSCSGQRVRKWEGSARALLRGVDEAWVSKGCVSPAAALGGPAVAGETQGKVEKAAPRVESWGLSRDGGENNRGGDLRALFIERGRPGECSGASGGAEEGSELSGDGSASLCPLCGAGTLWCSHLSGASLEWARPWGHLRNGVAGTCW